MKAAEGSAWALPLWIVVVAMFCIPVPTLGNPIADSLEAMSTGRLRFEFAARQGVRGDGSSVMISNGKDTSLYYRRDGAGRRDLCEPCRVQVTLSMRNDEILKLRWRVGARQRSTPQDMRNLGVVQAEDAREFLLQLIARTKDGVAEKALEAAALSESGVAWRHLLQLARDEERSSDLRSTALFWLGQEAQEVVADELEEIATDDIVDLQVRKAAIFALSQRPDTQSIPSLQRIVKEHRHPEIRRSALFWLAQKESPEVTDFFEEILSESSGR